MTLLRKIRRLHVKRHLNIIFCRHLVVIAALTIGFGAFAFFTDKNIFVASGFGLVLGIALGYLREPLELTLNTPDDVRYCSQLLYLGHIPLTESKVKGGKDNMNLYFRNDPKLFRVFKKLTGSILTAVASGNRSQIFVVSSPVPKEGKSFVAANLALAFATAGEPTLLIDGDMRKGEFGEMFKINRRQGLASLLAGISSFRETVFTTSIENLSLMPRGAVSPNPSELLTTDRIRMVLREAGIKFSKVVVDSSPVLSVADALVFSRESDGLILVVKAGATPLQHIIDAQKIIGSKVRIIGVLLNYLDLKNSQH